MTLPAPLSLANVKRVYPVSIKDKFKKKHLVGLSIHTRLEIFENILRTKRNLKERFCV